MEMMMGLDKLVMSLKSKLRFSRRGGSSGGNSSYFNSTNCGYSKVEKSESMRMEMKSRKARKLIADTLKIADSKT
uniref:Uncharacterized protein n=1 Tax=Kalanchoe fedtschenkoi TaxID=63787 RepID=A0A7N0T8T6_KALFE